MEIYTEEDMWTENLQDLDSIIGQMEAISKEHLRMASEMDRAFGRKQQEIATNMRDSTKMIKKQDTAYLRGVMEMFIRETTRTIWGTGMERCTGMMAVFIREIGWMEPRMVKVIFY